MHAQFHMFDPAPSKKRVPLNLAWMLSLPFPSHSHSLELLTRYTSTTLNSHFNDATLRLKCHSPTLVPLFSFIIEPSKSFRTITRLCSLLPLGGLCNARHVRVHVALLAFQSNFDRGLRSSLIPRCLFYCARIMTSRSFESSFHK